MISTKRLSLNHFESWTYISLESIVLSIGLSAFCDHPLSRTAKKKKKINRNLRQAFRHPFLRPSTFFEMILLHNLSFMSVMLCGKHCFGLLKNIRGIPSCFHVNSLLWLISVNYSENNVRHINKYNQKRKSEPHEGRKVSKKFTGSKGIMVLKKRLEHMIQVRKKTSFAS